jgi:hypothetical protein
MVQPYQHIATSNCRLRGLPCRCTKSANKLLELQIVLPYTPILAAYSGLSMWSSPLFLVVNPSETQYLGI